MIRVGQLMIGWHPTSTLVGHRAVTSMIRVARLLGRSRIGVGLLSLMSSPTVPAILDIRRPTVTTPWLCARGRLVDDAGTL